MATVKKYNSDVTVNVLASGAIAEGLLYGINSSAQAVAADRATGPVICTGFAIRGISAADATAGKVVALCPVGIIECLAADIAGGAFTVGANVYLDTAGKYTTTRPSTAGNLIQAIGVALSATKVAVNVTQLTLTVQAAGTTTIAP